LVPGKQVAPFRHGFERQGVGLEAKKQKIKAKLE
jgi:hypothetical protein